MSSVKKEEKTTKTLRCQHAAQDLSRAIDLEQLLGSWCIPKSKTCVKESIANMEESREEWSVFEWLAKAGMSEYAQSFVDNGYDTPELCARLKNDDLTEIGVKDKRHKSVIFSQAKELMTCLNPGEVTDGHENPYAEPIVKVVKLDTSSPTQPTGSYSEPWQSYTEPWSASPNVHSNGVSPKLKKTGSDDKPFLPPPNKSKKKHQPPSPLPKDLPAFKRPEGLGDSPSGLTKLQLQLKIREELREEGILLSERPYVDEVSIVINCVLYQNRDSTFFKKKVRAKQRTIDAVLRLISR